MNKETCTSNKQNILAEISIKCFENGPEGQCSVDMDYTGDDDLIQYLLESAVGKIR